MHECIPVMHEKQKAKNENFRIILSQLSCGEQIPIRKNTMPIHCFQFIYH